MVQIGYKARKDIVSEHKMIKVYFEIKSVFREMDEHSRNVARVSIQSCYRRLVLDDSDNEHSGGSMVKQVKQAL